MAKRWLHRIGGALALLGATSAIGAPLLVVSRQIRNVPKTPIGSTVTNGVIGVNKDVANFWNYECLQGPSGAQTCAPRWQQAPRLSYNVSFNLNAAQRAYASILNWSQYQYAFLSSDTMEYKSIVYSQDIFTNYYLPPHASAGEAKTQWAQIYDSIDPIIRRAYETENVSKVAGLIGSALSYSPSFAGLPRSVDGNLLAGGADQNYASSFAPLLDTAGFVQNAGLIPLVFASLYSGMNAVPDLGTALLTYLNSGFQSVVNPHAEQFAAYQKVVDDDFTFTQNARLSLDTSAEQQNFDRVLQILRTAGLFFLSRYPQAAQISKLLSYNWNAQQVADRMADAILMNRFTAVSYTPTAISSAQNLADEVFNFGTAIYRLDTVKVANNYEPSSNLGASTAFYGPRFVAGLSSELVRLANLGQTASAINPDLIELYEQYQQLIESGKFTAEDLARYWNGSLTDLFNNQPVKDDLIRLIEKAIAADPDNQALKDALAKIANEGLNTENFASLFEQLNRLLEVSSQVTTYVFIGIGAAVALISLTASYSLVKGYRAKKKYGTNLLEYTRSKRMLLFVALVAGVVGVALVAIAAAGVL